MTACSDGKARIWNTETGNLVCDTLEHTDKINTVFISNDSTKIITSSDDCNVKIWNCKNYDEILNIQH